MRGLILAAGGDYVAALSSFADETATGASGHIYAHEFAANSRVATGAIELIRGDREAAEVTFSAALRETPGHARAMIGWLAACAPDAPAAEHAARLDAADHAIDELRRGERATEAALVSDSCMVRTYEPGERIISEGEPGDSMYFIRSGLVKVSTATPVGMIELGELKPGDYFGEVSLLNRVKRTATISALELTEVLVLDRTPLDRLRPQIPDLIEKLESGLQSRAKATIAAIQKQLGG